ncbi:muts domain V-domain-containing protein [Cladorrhinum sp. PSN332]|nr:muts domain V-domain-containing protein [Cladorrhinum sp. PSN332]
MEDRRVPGRASHPPPASFQHIPMAAHHNTSPDIQTTNANVEDPRVLGRASHPPVATSQHIPMTTHHNASPKKYPPWRKSYPRTIKPHQGEYLTGEFSWAALNAMDNKGPETTADEYYEEPRTIPMTTHHNASPKKYPPWRDSKTGALLEHQGEYLTGEYSWAALNAMGNKGPKTTADEYYERPADEYCEEPRTILMTTHHNASPKKYPPWRDPKMGALLEHQGEYLTGEYSWAALNAMGNREPKTAPITIHSNTSPKQYPPWRDPNTATLLEHQGEYLTGEYSWAALNAIGNREPKTAPITTHNNTSPKQYPPWRDSKTGALLEHQGEYLTGECSWAALNAMGQRTTDKSYEELETTTAMYGGTRHESRDEPTSLRSGPEALQQAVGNGEHYVHDNHYNEDDDSDNSEEGLSEAQMKDCRARLRALLASADDHPVDSSIVSPMIARANEQPIDAYSRSFPQGASVRGRSSRIQSHPRKHTSAHDVPMLHAEQRRTQEVQEFMTKVSLLGFDKDSESDPEEFQPTSPIYQSQIPDRTSTDKVREEHEVICAIAESGNKKVIGIAAIDLTVGQATITRVVIDNGYKTLIETLWRMQHRPQTFVLLKKIFGDNSKLSMKVREQFPDGNFVPWDRSFWSEKMGLAMVSKYAYRGDEAALHSGLEGNFYAACAWSAAMTYVEKTSDTRFLPNSVHVVYTLPAKIMGLDRATVSALELLQTARRAKAGPKTLFGILNHTVTPQGRRLLRSTILQPTTDDKLLTQRWDAVQELSSSQDFFNDVRASLQKLQRIDVEQVMTQMGKEALKSRQPIQAAVVIANGKSRIITAGHEELRGAERDLNHILMIKTYLQVVGHLHETLNAAGCTSYFCDRAKRKSASKYTAPVLKLIGRTIQEDASFSKRPIDIRNNRLWAVKAGYDSVLDVSRDGFRLRTREINSYFERLRAHFEERIDCSPTLVLGTDNHYRLRFHWSDVEKEAEKGVDRRGKMTSLAGVAILNAERKNKQFFCQTRDLVRRSTDLQYFADAVAQHSDRIIMDLKLALFDEFSFVHATAGAVSYLDMLCSFAHLATSQNYVRPIFSKTLFLKNARHPVLEIRKKNIVANDVLSGDQELRFMVVTGSNMSGKSTYIKSVALVQILAQIGCFVPASEASISICDQIFTRLSTEDKPELNLGTWAVECAEIGAILDQASGKSMVIIDELGRGTSTKEGFGVALGTCRELIKKGARVFFATHFPEIGELLNRARREQTLNVHFEAQSNTAGEITPRISLPHKVIGGPVEHSDYGIDFASRALPQYIIDNARVISRFLSSGKTWTKYAPATREEKIKRLKGGFLPVLRQAINSPMNSESLAKYAADLQKELRYKLATAKDDEDVSRAPATVEEPRPQKPIIEKMPETERQKWSKRGKEAEDRIMQGYRARRTDKKRKRRDREEEPAADNHDLRQTKRKRRDFLEDPLADYYDSDLRRTERRRRDREEERGAEERDSRQMKRKRRELEEEEPVTNHIDSHLRKKRRRREREEERAAEKRDLIKKIGLEEDLVADERYLRVLKRGREAEEEKERKREFTRGPLEDLKDRFMDRARRGGLKDSSSTR